MTQRFGFTAAAMLCATTLTWAQAPQPQDEPGMQSDESKTVTVVGCLRTEADVPGRSPNVAEQAGIAEDYILTEVSEQSSASGQSPSTPSSPSSAGSMAGMSASNLKIEGIDDEQLKQHVGKRVEVTGTIDDANWRSGGHSGMPGTTQPGTTQPGTTRPGTTEPGQTGQVGEPGTAEPGTTEPGRTTPGTGMDDDLTEIEATSIREVSGECQSQMP